MQAVLNKIKALLGPDSVVDGARAAAELGQCTTGAPRSIAAVVYPSDSAQVVSIVKLANEYGAPLYPVSTGHNWGYGTTPITDGCIVLNLSRLNRIVAPVDPVTGLVTIEPGVSQGLLADYLERQGLPFMVPTSGAGPSASIVGNALERGFGITPITDHFMAVTGIEAVLPDGSIYRSPHVVLGASSGGNAFKWGVGPYTDGLFTQGGFGVVTKMTLALARRPESIKAFVCRIATESALEKIVSASQNIVQRLPGVVGGINVMNAHRVLSMSASYPRDRLGPNGVIPEAVLAQLRARHRVVAWTVFGTLYGTKRIVAAAQKEVRRFLSPLTARRTIPGLTFISPQRADMLDRTARKLPLVRDGIGRTLAMLSSSMAIVGGHPNQTALPLAYWRSGRRVDSSAHLDPGRDGCGLIWYAPVLEMKPGAVTRFVNMVVDLMPRYGLEPLITMTSVSERCFVSSVPLLFDLASSEETAAAHECLSALLNVGAEQGFLPYRTAGQSMAWLMNRAPEHWRFVSQLKQAIDPNGIISPGRYSPVVSARGKAPRRNVVEF